MDFLDIYEGLRKFYKYAHLKILTSLSRVVESLKAYQSGFLRILLRSSENLINVDYLRIRAYVFDGLSTCIF